MSRCGAASSSHSGSIFAAVRAKSCDVSTSSNAITHAGGFRASADDGWIAKRVCFAPDVDALLRVPLADLGEQPGEERAMQSTSVARRCPARALRVARLQLADDLLELAVDLAPLAHAHEREEVLLARRAAGCDVPLRSASRDELPQPEEPDEVGALVAEAPVELVGLLLRLARPLARILDVERRGDDEHLAQAAELGAGEDHPADARVDREARELLAERRRARAPRSSAPSSSSTR